MSSLYEVYVIQESDADIYIAATPDYNDAMNGMIDAMKQGADFPPGENPCKGGYVMEIVGLNRKLTIVGKVYRKCITVWAVRDSEGDVVW